MWLNMGYISVKVRILDETIEEAEKISGGRPLNVEFEDCPIDIGWDKVEALIC